MSSSVERDYLKVVHDYSLKQGFAYFTYAEVRRRRLFLTRTGSVVSRDQYRRTLRRLRDKGFIRCIYLDATGTEVDPTTAETRGLGANDRRIYLTEQGREALAQWMPGYVKGPGTASPRLQGQSIPGPQASGVPGRVPESTGTVQYSTGQSLERLKQRISPSSYEAVTHWLAGTQEALPNHLRLLLERLGIDGPGMLQTG